MKRDIIVSHSGVQHSYMVALAIQEMGRLRNYITSFYYKDSKFPYRMFKKIEKIDKILRKRNIKGLDQDFVTNIPYYELPEQVFRIIFGNNEVTNYLVYWRDRAFDKHASILKLDKDVKILIGYPNASLRSFEKIKGYGGICIIDLPIGYYKEAERILDEEKKRHPDFADSITYSNFDEHYKSRVDRELEMASYVVVPSEFVKNTLIRYGFSDNKIQKIPYGSYFEPINDREIKESKRNDQIKILYVGQISQRKGIKYLLEAVRLLKKENLNLKLTLVGKIYGSGEGLKKYKDFFEYIPFVSRNELKQIFLSHDLFVFPSLFEGFGLVILEALAHGLPVVTTTNTGAEAIVDGVNGFIIPIRDIDAIAQKITLLYDNRDMLMEMKVKALESSKRFTWELYRQRWKELINGIKR